MAVENYSTLGATTVAVGGYTAGSGTLNVVASAGSPAFPTSPNFRVVIQDQVTNAVKAVLKVTAIPNGTSFTVAADVGIDANAVAGDFVYGVITKLAWDAIRSDQNQVGLAAALPSTTGQVAGNTYSATDTPEKWVLSGGVWVKVSGYAPFGRIIPFQEPDNSAYAFVNQDTLLVTVPVTPGPILFRSVTSGTDEQMCYVRSYPATPFTLDARIVPRDWVWSNFQNMGICIVDSGATPKVLQFCVACQNGNFVKVYSWATPNSGPSTIAGALSIPQAGGGTGPLFPQFFRIVDNGTNIVFSISWDGSIYTQVYSAGRTSFLTPNRIGVSINALSAGTATSGILESWKVS